MLCPYALLKKTAPKYVTTEYLFSANPTIFVSIQNGGVMVSLTG